MNIPCKICGSPTFEHARGVIRNKYDACFLRCGACDFVFVESPSWLTEAYAEPINRSDTGYVWRNLWARDKMRQCIEMYLDATGKFLDYAAGYGMFVRLMRDAGYDFSWADLYCENLFARGFEAPLPLKGPFEAVTAFEVFEHLVDPLAELKILFSITPCLIFSTKLLPVPVPKLEDWWYYGVEHGQHISFYSRKSLELLAKQFGSHFASDGADLHVFSKKPVSSAFFQPPPPPPPRWKFWAPRRKEAYRPSLTVSDHDLIKKTLMSERSS